MSRFSRRKFVRSNVVGGLAAGATGAFAQAPAVSRGRVKPVVIASGNGNQFKNGGKETCVEHAFRLLTGGSDVLDALIAGGVRFTNGYVTAPFCAASRAAYTEA